MLLSMRHIDKLFWGKYANTGVCLDVEKGEVHALLGENGAGKTTLMNILYGIYSRDGGEIVWKGEPVNFLSPKDAIERNIGMVHQHFMLVPNLTVSENITLGLKEKGYPFTNRKALNTKITEISEKYGLEIQPNAYISSLSVGEQQRVEIMKLLYRKAELLILDEPTGVLTPQETLSFFNVLRKLRADGCAVILITHRIPEVMEIADRITVLRDTKSIVTVAKSEIDEFKLSEYMIGRALKPVTRREISAHEGGGLVLSAVSLQEKGQQHLHEVTLTVHPGEILGIAGVDGNGQKELAEVILGIRKHSAGSVALFGKPLDALGVKKRKDSGIAYISDDRHKDGLAMDMDLTGNMLLKFNSDKRMLRYGFINKKSIREKTENDVKSYDIKAHSLDTPIRYLSGGNQQKLILARELSDEPRLVVAFQATRGLDIGATEFIQRQLLTHRERGACILLISADLDEIRALSDRIAVMHKGRIMGELENTQEIDMTAVGLMMAGKDICDNKKKEGQAQ